MRVFDPLYHRISMLLLCILSLSNSAWATSFANETFSDSIHSVQILKELSTSNNLNTQHAIPYIHLGSSEKLDLRFDLLGNNAKQFSYSLVHCTPNWEPTDLNSNEYIDGYEEDNISNFTFSQNTSQAYIHYHLPFPSNQMKLTKAGNYVVVVYESGDRSKVVLTQKFFVLQQKMIVTPLPSFVMATENRTSHHQISFKANQGGIQSNDPFHEYKFVVLQNGNFNSSINLHPTHISGNWISFFGNEVSFESGNEFRQFDTRNINLNTNGIGVYKTVYKKPHYHCILRPSENRSKLEYSNYPDHNGAAYRLCQDNKSPHFETDYTWVYFYYNCESPDSTKKLYIFGGLSNWEKKESFRMKYNAKTKQYVCKAFLKQGVYDYAIMSSAINQKGKLSWSSVEGNFYQTNNDYSILIYHKAFVDNAYQLVGLKNFRYR